MSIDTVSTKLTGTAKHDGERQQQIDSIDGTLFDPKFERRSDQITAIWSDIERLGLQQNVAEFEAKGFTVVPPEKLATVEFIERLREALLCVGERRDGVRLDLHGASAQDSKNPLGKNYTYMLFDDPAFQQAVVNPTMLALAHYTLGRSAILYDCTGALKGPGVPELVLHSDNFQIPSPFPSYPQIVNFTWTLTDYSKEDGGTCFVPGSHRYARHPEPGEGYDERVAPDAPAGSLLMWHSNTWHGSFVKKTPGLRASMVTAMCRSYLRPQEPYMENMTKDILEANPEMFAQVAGCNVGNGWKEEGPNYVKAASWPGKSQWD